MLKSDVKLLLNSRKIEQVKVNILTWDLTMKIHTKILKNFFDNQRINKIVFALLPAV